MKRKKGVKKDFEIKKKIYGLIIAILTFWLSDFILHNIGVGESPFYFISKFANAVIFGIMWFFVFSSKSHFRKLIYSFIFGTWISFYYLISSYSGLVQTLGIYALSSPPPFVIGSLVLHPIIWWFTHALGFYAGLELADVLNKK